MTPLENSDLPVKSNDEQFAAEVHRKEERKIKARRHQGESIWFGLGMMGLVGWSVAVPTLLGIALGVWIDSAFKSRYSWTLMCLFVGVVLGCLNAWYWVKRHGKQD